MDDALKWQHDAGTSKSKSDKIQSRVDVVKCYTDEA
jgi:hypothetical protein